MSSKSSFSLATVITEVLNIKLNLQKMLKYQWRAKCKMRSQNRPEDSFRKKVKLTLHYKKKIFSKYSFLLHFYINIYNIPVTCFFNFSISSFKLLISKSLLAAIGPSTVEYCRAWTVWVDSRKRYKREGQITHLTSKEIRKKSPI